MPTYDEDGERLETPLWAQNGIRGMWSCLAVILWVLTICCFLAAFQHPTAGLLVSQFGSGFSDAEGGMLCCVLAIGATVIFFVAR